MPYKNAKQDGPCFTQFIKKKKQIKALWALGLYTRSFD